MENEVKDKKEKHTLKDEVTNIGKIIVGELESIGGVITADSIARAEGDLTADEGILREKIAHDSDEKDEEEK
jgi:hypothetical protein